jgi:hypothetical protein
MVRTALLVVPTVHVAVLVEHFSAHVPHTMAAARVEAKELAELVPVHRAALSYAE